MKNWYSGDLNTTQLARVIILVITTLYIGAFALIVFKLLSSKQLEKTGPSSCLVSLIHSALSFW